jgi:hypothetical protein
MMAWRLPAVVDQTRSPKGVLDDGSPTPANPAVLPVHPTRRLRTDAERVHLSGVLHMPGCGMVVVRYLRAARFP